MRAGLDLKRGLSRLSHARATTSDRARDFVATQETRDEQEERVVNAAETIYRSFFGYRDAFPTPEQESSWASSVWTMACAKTGIITIAPSANLMERVSSDSPFCLGGQAE